MLLQNAQLAPCSNFAFDLQRSHKFEGKKPKIITVIFWKQKVVETSNLVKDKRSSYSSPSLFIAHFSVTVEGAAAQD